MGERKNYERWAGWSGTVLLITCWPLIGWTDKSTFVVWLGLMMLSATLCFVGVAYRSKWFLLPGVFATIVTIGTLAGAIFGK